MAKSIEEIRAEEEKAAQEAAKAAKEAEAKKRAEAEKKAANSSDVAVLAALVQLEAGGESYEGKLAVASVVMNRVRSGGYPQRVRCSHTRADSSRRQVPREWHPLWQTAQALTV